MGSIQFGVPHIESLYVYIYTYIYIYIYIYIYTYIHIYIYWDPYLIGFYKFNFIYVFPWYWHIDPHFTSLSPCQAAIFHGFHALLCWWFGTFGLFFYILGIIIPTDFHIFQRGRSTTKQYWLIRKTTHPCFTVSRFTAGRWDWNNPVVLTHIQEKSLGVRTRWLFANSNSLVDWLWFFVSSELDCSSSMIWLVFIMK